MNDMDIRIRNLEEQQKRQESDIFLLQEKVGQMQGFSSGVAWAFACIGAVLVFAWDKLVNH